MKIVAINGSPRKAWNTATLLQHALEGAASSGAETSLRHLYDYAYRGCVSCLQCKRVGAQRGHCALDDGLTPLLEEIAQADALVVGSPVYFYGETGMFRSFMERLLFPWLSYEADTVSYFTGRLACGVIYTMNITEEQTTTPRPGMPPWLRLDAVRITPLYFERVFGNCAVLTATDTLQVRDYGKYAMNRFDAGAKQRSREERFPEDCARAHALGRALCAGA